MVLHLKIHVCSVTPDCYKWPSFFDRPLPHKFNCGILGSVALLQSAISDFSKPRAGESSKKNTAKPTSSPQSNGGSSKGSTQDAEPPQEADKPALKSGETSKPSENSEKPPVVSKKNEGNSTTVGSKDEKPIEYVDVDNKRRSKRSGMCHLL